MKKMRLLITGGAGCLGSNLIEHWLPQGHEIYVIDNFATGKHEVVPSIPGLTVCEGTVSDAAFVQSCFKQFLPEVVVHAAAAYKNPDDWQEDALTNVVGSVNVAKAAEACGARRVINFQTALCYGRPKQVPIPVSHRLAPFTSYGITKTAGEQLMFLSKIPTLSLRIANVTGPRLAIGPIPTFYKRLKAGQKCFCSDTARDFIDMSDFLDFMDLAVQDNAPTGFFNISSGEAHTIKEIFELVAEHLQINLKDVPVVPPTADDVSLVSLDPSKTFQVFGWKVKIAFAETVRRQLQWYDRHGVSDVFSHLKIPDQANRDR
jgi:nucleoside-diphosphate-sugar epimerase